MKAFVPDMMDRNHGHIVCMNSMLGLMGLAGAADYAASKHALTGYMESLQVELVSEKKMGVHITSVHPYMVDTGMFAGCTTRWVHLVNLIHVSEIPRIILFPKIFVAKIKHNIGNHDFSVAVLNIWNQLLVTVKSSETLATFI